MCPTHLSPVSYTHLDVYKRQEGESERERKREREGEREVEGERDMNKWKATSCPNRKTVRYDTECMWPDNLGLTLMPFYIICEYFT